MATDVLIDPTSGQIYWNDGTGSPESIAIKGDAVNTISFTGYSGSFSPGSTPAGALTLVTIKDSAGTDALIPGTSGYNLGSSTLRWNTFATNANLSGTLVVSDSTGTTSLLTGSARFNGGIAISGGASIGQTLFLFNGANYTAFVSSASGNTVYTLPATSPATGNSVLQSTSAGILSWVPLAASSGGTVYNGTVAQLAFYGATGNTLGGASGVTYNPTSGLFYITHTTPSFSTTTGALIVTGGVGIGGSLFTAPTSKSSISGVSFNNSRAENGFTINTTSSYTFNIQDAANNQRLNYHGDSNRTEFTGNNATHEIRLIHSNNSGYTGLKSNSSGTVTYTFPAGDGSNGQFLQTNGSGALSWATATGGAGGGSSGVNAGGQYQIGYYAATGASIDGSSTFTNNTSTAVVSITHVTASTDSSNGALKVTGGVGIGGSLYVGGIGASITGVTFSNSTITRGTWNGTAISPTYGGTGLNNSSATGLLQYSSGTASVITTSAALALIISDETGTAGKLVFSTSPVFNTSVTTDSGSFSVFNTTATTINAFGAATTLSVGAATGKVTINSTDDSSSTITGSLAVSGGAGIAKSVSIGGRLQMFNGANFTAFVSSASGNTVYTLPATSPATGSSVLQSTSAGVMSWVPMVASSSGAGSGTVAIPDAQYRIAFYAGTGASVSSTNLITAVGTGVTILGATNASSTTVAALSILGGLGITGNAFIGGTVTIQDSTVSASTTTGALVVAGGIGVGGKVFADVLQSSGNAAVGGNLTVAGTVDLGNAVADSISFLGRVDTDIDPIATNTYDLGDSSLVWKNVSIGSSAIFYNTSNAFTLGFRAGVSGASLIYTLPIDTPTAGQVLSASAPSGGVVTLSWEDDQTGAPAGGITTLNTLTTASQSFATGTSGTDFAISSVTSTHTFNLPDASATARGLVTTGTQTLAGAKTFTSALSVTASTAAINTTSGALVVTGGVGIGGSLYTATGSSSSISGVVFANNTVSSSTYNKVAITAPATLATLTLSNNSSLITSGGHSLTFTTTSTTNVTVPTTGTLATTSNKLSDFAATTSLELKNTISDETGSGALVFATSPDFTTSVTTGSATFSLFNATATNISAFGAATTLSIGAASGKATINSVDNSTSSTTGAFVVTGGAAVGQSLSIAGRLQMFNGANFTAFVSSASGNTVYTLPATSPATGSSVLQSTSTGVMSWVPMTAGGSGTPGGSNKQIQYNNASAFGGASGFEYITAGIANTVSIFSASGTGYTSGLWIHAINGSTTRVGIGLSNPQFELEINGELSATNKSFVIDHPTKSGMKLRYGSLEGPENGVYVRGELNNSNIIEVPDHWIGLVHEDSYTVHLTPIGKYAQLYVEKIENYNVYIADNHMNPIHCYYSVWAERKDIPKLVTEY